MTPTMHDGSILKWAIIHLPWDATETSRAKAAAEKTKQRQKQQAECRCKDNFAQIECTSTDAAAYAGTFDFIAKLSQLLASLCQGHFFFDNRASFQCRLIIVKLSLTPVFLHPILCFFRQPDATNDRRKNSTRRQSQTHSRCNDGNWLVDFPKPTLGATCSAVHHRLGMGTCSAINATTQT